jgi:hypothetical protein
MRANSNGDEVMLAWQRAERPGAVEFVVTDDYADEVLSLLAARDVVAARSPTAFRGTGDDLVAVVVAVADSPTAWAAIGVAIKAFFDRHKGKRIRVDEDGVVDASNYSAGDIERIIRALARRDLPEGSVEKPDGDQ